MIGRILIMIEGVEDEEVRKEDVHYNLMKEGMEV
jgi:hypothetical protein